MLAGRRRGPLRVPVRSDLPNTDVALLLVLCVGAVAMVGGRQAVLVGSLAGATAFDYFDTSPYGQLFITRGRDIATTVVLVGASLLVESSPCGWGATGRWRGAGVRTSR